MAACAALAAMVGIGWVYTHPPLSSRGHSERSDDEGNIVVYGIDLDNRGRWPLTLTAVTVGGKEVLPPHAVAVANFADGQIAGSAAIDLEANGYKLTIGPIYGWEILSQRHVRGFRYAIRLDLRGLDAEPGRIVVHYRYLGLPLRYDVTP
ncbi:hypothetical protein [Symbiobacterium terraclitae]|uniref:hypothetical protein n=1 Tax=Symbiobacterium terraclitae TaxID=557451 RepID=UPI0035B4FEEE